METKTPEQTETTTEAPISRDEFQKLKEHGDSIASQLRKERAAWAERTAALEAQLKDISTKLQPQAPAADDARPDPQLAAYAAKLKEMESKFEGERKAREQEQQARITQERRTALSQELTARGVTGAHLKAAMAYIFDAQQMVAHDDAGQVGIRLKRAGYDEVVPIGAALDELFKMDDYKIFLPPRPVAGSGTVPSGAHPTNGRGLSPKEQALRALPAAILGALGR